MLLMFLLAKFFFFKYNFLPVPLEHLGHHLINQWNKNKTITHFDD